MFSNKLKITKNFLKTNPDIFFTSADKGNLTICLNKYEYYTKMLNLLSDRSTYKLLEKKKNPLKKLQDNTYEILKSLNDNDFLKYKHHNNQLTLTSTVLARCYGLPKIHKKDVPLRLIISLINSPTYFLAKILYEELKDNLNTLISHINNSFELK